MQKLMQMLEFDILKTENCKWVSLRESIYVRHTVIIPSESGQPMYYDVKCRIVTVLDASMLDASAVNVTSCKCALIQCKNETINTIKMRRKKKTFAQLHLGFTMFTAAFCS